MTGKDGMFPWGPAVCIHGCGGVVLPVGVSRGKKQRGPRSTRLYRLEGQVSYWSLNTTSGELWFGYCPFWVNKDCVLKWYSRSHQPLGGLSY